MWSVGLGGGVRRPRPPFGGGRGEATLAFVVAAVVAVGSLLGAGRSGAGGVALGSGSTAEGATAMGAVGAAAAV